MAVATHANARRSICLCTRRRRREFSACYGNCSLHTSTEKHGHGKCDGNLSFGFRQSIAVATLRKRPQPWRDGHSAVVHLRIFVAIGPTSCLSVCSRWRISAFVQHPRRMYRSRPNHGTDSKKRNNRSFYGRRSCVCRPQRRNLPAERFESRADGCSCRRCGQFGLFVSLR